jgi:hypothetical protein
MTRGVRGFSSLRSNFCKSRRRSAEQRYNNDITFVMREWPIEQGDHKPGSRGNDWRQIPVLGGSRKTNSLFGRIDSLFRLHREFHAQTVVFVGVFEGKKTSNRPK